MDIEVASHCVGPLTRDYLSKLPHHVVPSMNLQRIFPFNGNHNVVSEYFSKNAPWKSSLPIPLTSLVDVPFQVLNGVDTTTTLIREKLRWQMKKKKILTSVKKDKKNISEKTMRRTEVADTDTTTSVPRGVALLAQHLDKDPDPQFAGVYNWYYTGGTLATLKNNEENYLLHPSQSKLSCSKLNEDGNKSELLFTLALERSTPIYQIATNSVGAVARQKSCVSLFTINETDDRLCLKKIHSVSDSRNPFMSIALRDNSNKKYCTLSNNGTLKLWDVEYTKSHKMKMLVTPGEGVTVMDSWSSIQFLDNRTLLLADRCCIHLLDVRMDMREKMLAWCPRKLGEQCEQLSYVSRSQLQDQVVYTMTTHQALILDLRIGFCQRWSHMISAPPYVGFTHAIDNEEELLCIGSQVMSECVVMGNRWRGEDPQAEYRHTILPSPSQGLLLARQQGLCLKPTFDQRFCQSLIGLTCLPGANGLYIVRQSATGDMFVQHLGSKSSNQLTDKQMSAYTDWDRLNTPQQQGTNTVTVTDVKDFTPILEALKDTFPPEERDKSTRPGDGEMGGGWRCSKQYLEDCVDLLAPRLLSVWEVEDENEWQQEEEGETLVEQDPVEKVHNWLLADNVATHLEHTLDDKQTLNYKVTSTPYVMPSMELESPTKSVDEPSLYMANPEQTSRAHNTLLPLTPNALSAPPSLVSSGSDKPPRKRQRLFEDVISATPPKQLVQVVKKPPTSAVKKKFIPGF